jgi:hypothetical protein
LDEFVRVVTRLVHSINLVINPNPLSNYHSVAIYLLFLYILQPVFNIPSRISAVLWVSAGNPYSAHSPLDICNNSKHTGTSDKFSAS